MPLPDKIVIGCIAYRISRPEPWTVIFTQASPFGDRPTKFMLHREPLSLWQFQVVDGWGDLSCTHLTHAYEWAKARIGDDHAAKPFPEDQPHVEHTWVFSQERNMTYCIACGYDMLAIYKYRSCEGAARLR